MTSKVRVLIADDSALMRKLLAEILNGDPDIEVVGAVGDAYKAREEIKRLNPDVLTLDVEMPRMDGISFLEKIMRLRPMPVVMISAMTEKGADITMKALMLGAVDFISKPKIELESGLIEYAEIIRDKVKTAAGSKPTRRQAARSPRKQEASASRSGTLSGRYELVALGASTGGVETIHSLVQKLPGQFPPIVITQHIPPVFSASFAQRLNDQVQLTACEAKHGQPLLPGHIYVAPGDQHLLVARQNGQLVARLKNDKPVNRHMPSVDVLFNSVAESVGKKAIGVILTGMGDDGARGLLNLKNQGAMTIAQDKNSCVIWGMPREAVEIGAAQVVLPLKSISERLVAFCSGDTVKGEASGEVESPAGTAG